MKNWHRKRAAEARKEAKKARELGFDHTAAEWDAEAYAHGSAVNAIEIREVK